jgi:hypothetical protein
MEKIFTHDVSRIFMLLGMGAVGLVTLFLHFVSKLKGSFKAYRKATVLYLLLCLLLFAAIAVTAHPFFSFHPAGVLIGYQCIFLIFGGLHLYFMDRMLPWSHGERTFWLEPSFSLAIGLFGAILFIWVYNLFNKQGLVFIMAGSILFFIIPFFFYHAFCSAMAISPKVRKQWIYPVQNTMEEPDESKLKNMLVVSFELEKQDGDMQVTNFRAKAPVDMNFSQLFYYFINDYNERHPASRIQCLNAAGDPYGWIFYKKPKWHSLFTRYVDSDKTVFNNRIKENDVIICSRILN